PVRADARRFRECTAELSADTGEGFGQGAAPADEHVVGAGQRRVGCREANGFAQTPADAVALHRLPRRALGHGEAETCGIVVPALPPLQNEGPTRGLATLRDGQEVAPLLQALDATPRRAHADRRLRPLARRRARTWRPFLVAMRARKPWRRL